MVAQPTPEFGLRRAVGAQIHDLLFLVARQDGVPVLAGLGAGPGAAAAALALLGAACVEQSTPFNAVKDCDRQEEAQRLAEIVAAR